MGSLRASAAPAIKSALLKTGGFSAIRRLWPSRSVAILRYHAICGAEGHAYADPGICITPSAFDEHVRYLTAHYAVMPLPEAVQRMREGRALPPNAVVITFDDGYQDNLAAARTLHRQGVSGTFYITSHCMQGGAPFWPSEVRALVAAMKEPVLRLALPASVVEIDLGQGQARDRAIPKINRLFKSHPVPVRESLREQMRKAAGDPQLPSPMLTWGQLAEMGRLGMTIGAHTMTHPNLPSAGLETAEREIVGAKTRLERELGSEVTMFSYPNGGAERYYTPEIQRIVAGHYAAAATSKNGLAGPGSDLYALERVEVEERLEDLTFALEVERFLFAPA